VDYRACAAFSKEKNGNFALRGIICATVRNRDCSVCNWKSGW